MQKKNTPASATSLEPQNQPLANVAPSTTTTAAPLSVAPVGGQTQLPPMALPQAPQEPQVAYAPKNLELPSPSVSGTSAQAPSISAGSVSPAYIDKSITPVKPVSITPDLVDSHRDNMLNNKLFSGEYSTQHLNEPSFEEQRQRLSEIAATLPENERGRIAIQFQQIDEDEKRSIEQAKKNRAGYINALVAKGYDRNTLETIAKSADESKKKLAQSQAFLKENPNSPLAVSFMADSYLGLGQYDKAIDAYKAAFGAAIGTEADANSEAMLAQNPLAMNIQTTKASNLGAKSLYGIGLAQTKKKDYQSALSTYTEALNHAIETGANETAGGKSLIADINQGIAFAKYQLGDKAGARENIRQVNELRAKSFQEGIPQEAARAQIEAEAGQEKRQEKRAAEIDLVHQTLEKFIKGDTDLGVANVTPWGIAKDVASKMWDGAIAGLTQAAKGATELGTNDETKAPKTDILAGLGHTIFSMIPQVQVFNRAMEPIAVAAQENPDNKSLEILSDVVNLPFAVVSTIAKWTGSEPTTAEGKNWATLFDMVIPIAAHKAGISGIKNLKDFTELVEEQAKTPAVDMIQKINLMQDYAQNLTLADVREAIAPKRAEPVAEPHIEAAKMEMQLKEQEAAETQKQKDLNTVQDTQSKDFFDLAEETAADPSALERVKANLQEAVNNNLIDGETAQQSLDALRAKSEVAKKIPPSIVSPESRVKYANLLEDKAKSQERLKKFNSYDPPYQPGIETSKRTIELIDDQLNNLVEGENMKQTFSMGYAPFREGDITNLSEGERAFENEKYKEWRKKGEQFAADLGLKIEDQSNAIGAYGATSAAAEASAVISVTGPKAQVKAFAALMGTLAPNTQHSVMMLEYKEGGNAVANKITFDSKESAIEFVEKRHEYGLEDISLLPEDNSVLVLDFGNLNSEKLFNDYGKRIKKHTERRFDGDAAFINEKDYRGIIERSRDRFKGRNEGVSRTNFDSAAELAEARLRRRGKLYDEAAKQTKGEIEKAFDDAATELGLPVERTPATKVEVDVNEHKKRGEAYEKLPVDDSANPVVKSAYEALVKELNAQYEKLKDIIKIEFVEEDPYPDAKSMMEDVYVNKKLRVFKGGEDHPFLGEKSKDANGITANEKLRAVHDLVHAKAKAEFGINGEEAAWVEHSKTFSPEAQRALSTETRGQNAWVTTSEANKAVYEKFKQGKKLIDEGKIAEGKKLIEEGKKEFQYAPQKVALLPEEFTNWKEYEGAKKEAVEPIKTEDTGEPVSETTPGVEPTDIEAAPERAPGTETPPAEPPTEPPAIPPSTPSGEAPMSGETKTHAVWKRVLDSIQDEDLKEGLKKEGVEYLVNKEAVTESAAKTILDAAVQSDNLASLEKLLIDSENKLPAATRGTLSAMVGKHYFDLFKGETDPLKREQYRKEFRKFNQKAAAMATEGGQIGNIVGKTIKKLYANDPAMVVETLRQDMVEANESKLGKANAAETYKTIKEILESPEGKEEVRKAVEKGVAEEVEKLNKKLSASQKLKADKAVAAIEKFQNKIKANTYSSVPVAIINEGLTYIKTAIKAGASVIDAVELGIEKIKELHGKAWDKEGDFRKDMLKEFEAEGVETKKKLSQKQVDSLLDAIEKKAKRLNPKNREKFLKDVVQEVEKEGGLSEERFKELYAEALGLPTMTPELTTQIEGLAKTINEGVEAEKEYHKALDDLIEAQKSGAPQSQINQLTQQKNAALKNSVATSLKARQANSQLSTLMKGNKKLADSLIGMMQLGALTPGSIIKNMTAMPAELAFRFLSNQGQGALDWITSGLANVGLAPESFKERKVNSFARTKGGMLATPKAFKALFDTVTKGSFEKDYQSREVANKITPVDAYKNLVSGKTKGDISATAANIVEALPQGYMAAAMGRALAGPDALFRVYGEQAKAYELGKLKGLEGAELEKFMADPPPEALKEIQQAGDEITFQQDNYVTEALSGAKNALKRFYDKKYPGDLGNMNKAILGAIRVLGKSQALYVKTPTNVLGSVVKMMSPELSMLKASRELLKLKNADKQKLNKALADAAVAYAVRHFVVSAIQKGMITPTADYKSKEGQMQSDEDIKHAGKFNKSAWLRSVTGGDWKEQPDDIWVDYSKWTGGLGITMGAYAEMLKGKSPEEMTQMTMVKNSWQTMPTVVKQVMDLSFMSTTAQLMDAARDGKGVKKWASGTVGTLATPLLPNTATTVIKSTSDTKRETRGGSIMEQIANEFNYKLTGGADLPSKITLWGEKVDTAPEGANKLVYNLFNVVKAEDPDENSLGYKIMDLHKRTGDDRVIPTMPSNKVTIKGASVTLDGHEYEKFQEYVGSMRKQMATDYLNSEEYQADDDNQRAYRLGKIYSEAHKMGTDMMTKAVDRLADVSDELGDKTVVSGVSKRKRSRRGERRERRSRR